MTFTVPNTIPIQRKKNVYEKEGLLLKTNIDS